MLPSPVRASPSARRRGRPVGSSTSPLLHVGSLHVAAGQGQPLGLEQRVTNYAPSAGEALQPLTSEALIGRADANQTLPWKGFAASQYSQLHCTLPASVAEIVERFHAPLGTGDDPGAAITLTDYLRAAQMSLFEHCTPDQLARQPMLPRMSTCVRDAVHDTAKSLGVSLPLWGQRAHAIGWLNDAAHASAGAALANLDIQVQFAKGTSEKMKSYSAPLSPIGACVQTQQEHFVFGAQRCLVRLVPARLISVGLSPWFECGQPVNKRTFTSGKMGCPEALWWPIVEGRDVGLALLLNLLWKSQAALAQSMRRYDRSTWHERAPLLNQIICDNEINKNLVVLYYASVEHMQAMHGTPHCNGPAVFKWKPRQLRKQCIDVAALEGDGGCLAIGDHCPVWVHNAKFSSLSEQFRDQCIQAATAALQECGAAKMDEAAFEQFAMALARRQGLWSSREDAMRALSRGICWQIISARADIVYLNSRGQFHLQNTWDYVTSLREQPWRSQLLLFEGLRRYVSPNDYPRALAGLCKQYGHLFTGSGSVNFGASGEADTTPFTRRGVEKVVIDILTVGAGYKATQKKGGSSQVNHSHPCAQHNK